MEKIKDSIKRLSLVQKIAGILSIAILLGVTIIAINPSKKLIEMRNNTRREDVANILNAVYRYAADNEGKLPASITSNPSMICRSGSVSCDGLVDLSEIVGKKKYISSVPVDPTEKKEDISGYRIFKSSGGRLSVDAPNAENNATITVSK